MATYKQIHELEAATGPGILELDTDLGSVTFEGNDSDCIGIEVERDFGDVTETEADSRFDVSCTREGDSVRIVGRRNSGVDWFRKKRVHFRLHIPRHYKVDIRTAGGTVRGTGMQGELRVGTSGGSITLDGGSEEVKLKSSGGSIKLKNTVGYVEAKTSGGSIHAGVANGPIHLKTSGGSVRADIRGELAGDCDLKTSGGSIRLMCDKETAFRLGAKTSGGRVSCRLPIDPVHSDRQKLEGAVNGGGPQVTLKT